MTIKSNSMSPLPASGSILNRDSIQCRGRSEKVNATANNMIAAIFHVRFRRITASPNVPAKGTKTWFDNPSSKHAYHYRVHIAASS